MENHSLFEMISDSQMEKGDGTANAKPLHGRDRRVKRKRAPDDVHSFLCVVCVLHRASIVGESGCASDWEPCLQREGGLRSLWNSQDSATQEQRDGVCVELFNGVLVFANPMTDSQNRNRRADLRTPLLLRAMSFRSGGCALSACRCQSGRGAEYKALHQEKASLAAVFVHIAISVESAHRKPR
jgi:hypothetical protein